MKPGGRACGQSRLFLASEHLVHLWRTGADTDTFLCGGEGLDFYLWDMFSSNIKGMFTILTILNKS